MSQPLPASPNLDWLKRVAQERLEELREARPEAKLTQAQLGIAREHGFASWRALREKIQTIELERFRDVVQSGDVEATRRLLEGSEALRKKVNDPLFDFGRRAVHVAGRNPALMDVLLKFGADINLRSDWANGPFSVLDDCPEEAARQFIARGAKLTAHAAARLGWIDELRRLIEADPDVVHEKGGDGQRPLHFAKTVQVVDLLLDRGADIDARCVDHKSTAAQYALVERPNACRHLLERGAAPDVFMAARLGDTDLASRLIDADPSCLAARVNAPGHPPVAPFNIYCWSLGWYLSPHEVALHFGHQATYELLLNGSEPTLRLLVACSRADQPAARSLLRDNPDMIGRLKPQDHALLPFSMFYGRLDAVKLMLNLGFDPMARGVDGGTLLHAASWMGSAEIVSILLRDHRDRVDLELKDPTHGGSPLGWAAHGSEHCRQAAGDYAAVVETLIQAGSTLPRSIEGGSDAVQEVLRRNGVPDAE